MLNLALICLIPGGCRQTTIIAEESIEPSLDTFEPDTDPDSDPPEDETDTQETDTNDLKEVCLIPQYFSWTSSQPLVLPPDQRSIKDPTIVFFENKWHIYATLAQEGAMNLVYLNIENPEANDPVQIIEPTTTGLSNYAAAPQLFYFSPQQLWYLIYQSPEPSYSTSTDPTDVTSWSEMKQFMSMPSILTDEDQYSIDYWIICDNTDCYMFFSALNGVLYRAKTTKDSFPDGFEGTTQVVMEDERFRLYDASNVYRLEEEDIYLLLVSAIGSIGRYFRAFTADNLDGDWVPLTDTEDNSFASINNVTGANWSSNGISHGEMLRKNPDETMTLDPCNLQYLYSGHVTDEEEPENDFYALGLMKLVQ